MTQLNETSSYQSRDQVPLRLLRGIQDTLCKNYKDNFTIISYPDTSETGTKFMRTVVEVTFDNTILKSLAPGETHTEVYQIDLKRLDI